MIRPDGPLPRQEQKVPQRLATPRIGTQVRLIGSAFSGQRSRHAAKRRSRCLGLASGDGLSSRSGRLVAAGIRCPEPAPSRPIPIRKRARLSGTGRAITPRWPCRQDAMIAPRVNSGTPPSCLVVDGAHHQTAPHRCQSDTSCFVMPALVAGIHAFATSRPDVDARDKPGHDGVRVRRAFCPVRSERVEASSAERDAAQAEKLSEIVPSPP
jgi:hypothetical protein